jgi:WD40 repeat protein
VDRTKSDCRRDGRGPDLGRGRYPRATSAGHDGGVHAVAICADGTWLATASSRGIVRIWDADSTGGSGVTAIRVDGAVSDCAWFLEPPICASRVNGVFTDSHSGHRARHLVTQDRQHVTVPRT